jgi:hypothetical protein
MSTTSKITQITTLSAVLAGAVILSSVVSAVTPASALGACGRNYHRNAAGYCVWGGQNQLWCLRHTGHIAAYGRNGTRWC